MTNFWIWILTVVLTLLFIAAVAHVAGAIWLDRDSDP